MANQNQQKVPDLVPINGSTNVYVGQRYVPKFYDDGTEQHGATWDKTKVYEPLTIVLWEGDSYTSRTFVPAGVEITDTQYWLETGNFNAQLEALRVLVNSFEDTITENSVISASMQANNKNRNIIILGDSLSANGGWFTALSNVLSSYSITFQTVSVDNGGYDNSTWLTALSALEVKNPGKITDIYVCGFTWDLVNFTNTWTNANTFREYVKANYPNATVHNVVFGRPSNETNTARLLNNLLNANMDLINMMMVTNVAGPYSWNDNNLPTSALNTSIGVNAANAILWGEINSCEYARYFDVQLATGLTGNNISCGITVCKNVVTYSVRSIGVTGTLPLNTPILLGYAPDTFILHWNPMANNFRIMLVGSITLDDNTVVPCSVILYYANDNKLNANVGLYMELRPFTTYSQNAKHVGTSTEIKTFDSTFI